MYSLSHIKLALKIVSEMYVRVILKIGRRPANFISPVNKTYHKSQVAAERLVSLKVKVVGWLTRVYLHVV